MKREVARTLREKALGCKPSTLAKVAWSLVSESRVVDHGEVR